MSSVLSCISFPRLKTRDATFTLIALAIQLLAAPAAQSQQEGVIAGVILGAGGQPLPDARVSVQGSATGATTDAAGRFRIAGISGSQAGIEVRRIGYRMDSRQVRVGDTNLRIPLREQSIALDAVVVTGTPGTQSKRELGNAVTSL